MNIILSRFNNYGLCYFKFAATPMYSTKTHFGFQEVDIEEKTNKGI